MKTILFQGDSITDCGRNREDDTSLGSGYAAMVAGALGTKYPGEYQFLNRGISGNRSIDVYARISKDIINLKPDYMSLLIGVNDVWHGFSFRQSGISAKLFDRNCRMLLDETLEALPDLKIMLLGAFLTPGEVIEKYGEDFLTEVCLRADVLHRIADDYHLPFVDLQAAFDKACTRAPAAYWTKEGVHPWAPGHGVIANEWLRTFETMRYYAVK